MKVKKKRRKHAGLGALWGFVISGRAHRLDQASTSGAGGTGSGGLTGLSGLGSEKVRPFANRGSQLLKRSVRSVGRGS